MAILDRVSVAVSVVHRMLNMPLTASAVGQAHYTVTAGTDAEEN